MPRAWGMIKPSERTVTSNGSRVTDRQAGRELTRTLSPPEVFADHYMGLYALGTFGPWMRRSRVKFAQFFDCRLCLRVIMQHNDEQSNEELKNKRQGPGDVRCNDQDTTSDPTEKSRRSRNRSKVQKSKPNEITRKKMELGSERA